jgi:hypothetical protein
MTVANRWLRWAVASTVALLVSLAAFVLLGAALALASVALLGKGDLSNASGFMVLYAAVVPAGVLSFIAMCWMAVFLSAKLAPKTDV